MERLLGAAGLLLIVISDCLQRLFFPLRAAFLHSRFHSTRHFFSFRLISFWWSYNSLIMSELGRETVRLWQQVLDVIERVKQAEERVRQADEHAKQAEARVTDTTFLQYLHNVQTVIIPNLTIKTNPTN